MSLDNKSSNQLNAGSDIKTLKNKDQENVLKLLDEGGFFEKLENINLKQIRDSLNDKGYMDFFDLLTISLFVYALLTGENISILQGPQPDKKVREMLFMNKFDLSKDEIKTMKLIAFGYTDQEIADELNISLNGISKRVTRIFNKIGVRKRQKLAFEVYKAGII